MNESEKNVANEIEHKKAFEAEAAVIGSILIDERCLDTIEQRLVPEDMTTDANKAILKAAYTLKANGRDVDPVTIQTYLKSKGVNISNDYILDLYEITPTAANAEVYADIVKRNSIFRQLRQVGNELSEIDVTANPYSAILDVQTKLENISKSQQAPTIDGVEMGMDFINYRVKIEKAGALPCISTGYSQLDNLLGGGFLNEGLYIVGARPAMGKTTFALNIADNIAKSNKTVLFVSLEMSADQLMSKRIARETYIPATDILMKPLSAFEYEKVVAATTQLSERPLYLNRISAVTIPQLAVMATSIKSLSCIVVDYLGLIRPTRRRKSRYEEMTEISGALKSLAKRLKIPIVCLAQLNRELEGRAKKEPRLSDLRDTGAIEQDADGIIFLHRPDYYDDSLRHGNSGVELQVILAKNRHGDTGNIRMAFYPATSVITNAR